jgi:CRP/FNR family cyclic AMP-dependent transcriptional regulator
MRPAGRIADASPADPELAAALHSLGQAGWFAELSPELQAALGGLARLRRVERGATLYHVGDRPDGLYGLVDGAIDIAIPGEQGLDFTVHRAETGFWIGDLALLSDAPRLVTLRAATPATLVHLPGAPVLALSRTRPDLVRALYALTYRNMALALRLVANLGVASSEARIGLRLLYQLETAPCADGWLNLSQAVLSEMLALSQPTVQRSLRRLQDQGLIECGYGRIRVCDRVGLMRACGG